MRPFPCPSAKVNRITHNPQLLLPLRPHRLLDPAKGTKGHHKAQNRETTEDLKNWTHFGWHKNVPNRGRGRKKEQHSNPKGQSIWFSVFLFATPPLDGLLVAKWPGACGGHNRLLLDARMLGKIGLGKDMTVDCTFFFLLGSDDMSKPWEIMSMASSPAEASRGMLRFENRCVARV